jgi:predicted amidohydrolase
MSGREIVLRGGRVIHAESGYEAVADMAIGDGRVVQIGAGLPAAPADVDVAGLVVTAGFVDLHSHLNDLAGMRLQALDGGRSAPNRADRSWAVAGRAHWRDTIRT